MRGYHLRRLLDVATFGPLRRRRVLDRGLADLSLEPTSHRRPWRPGGPRHVAACAAVLGVVVVLGFSFVDLLPRAMPSQAAPADWPTYPVPEQHPDRVLDLPPAATNPAGAPFTFAATRPDGNPVRYDPCREVRVVVNPDGSPVGGTGLVREALREASRASGVALRYAGTTREVWSEERRSFQPDRYGNRWAPVLVSWSTEERHPGLAGSVAGVAGSTAVGMGEDRLHYVTGTATLDTVSFPVDVRSGADRAQARLIVLHELAHVIGLDHVEDRSQLLYHASSLEVRDYQPGDLAGLRILGDGPCYPRG